MRPACGAALVLLALGGCATARVYEGSHPASDLGRIEGDPALNAGLPIAAIIRKVDSTPIGVAYSRVWVLPGTHAVLVDCLVPSAHTTTRFELNIEVEAGERYVLVPESATGNRNCSEVRIRAR